MGYFVKTYAASIFLMYLLKSRLVFFAINLFVTTIEVSIKTQHL